MALTADDRDEIRQIFDDKISPVYVKLVGIEKGLWGNGEPGYLIQFQYALATLSKRVWSLVVVLIFVIGYLVGKGIIDQLPLSIV